MCYRRGNQNSRRKTSSMPLRRLIIHQKMKFGYMNSRRPSKSNLPSVPKPSKLLLQRVYAEPFSSLPYQILLQPIASTNINWSLLNCFPKHHKTFSQIWVWLEKDLANEPLKDITMERVRVEEFEESLCKDCG